MSIVNDGFLQKRKRISCEQPFELFSQSIAKQLVRTDLSFQTKILNQTGKIISLVRTSFSTDMLSQIYTFICIFSNKNNKIKLLFYYYFLLRFCDLFFSFLIFH
jgi:hypothetical protein